MEPNGNQGQLETLQPKDEVDFAVVSRNNNNYNYDEKQSLDDNNTKKASNHDNSNISNKSSAEYVPNIAVLSNGNSVSGASSIESIKGKKKDKSRERLSLFTFGKRFSQKTFGASAESSRMTPSPATTPSPISPPNATAPAAPPSFPCQPPFVPIGTPPRQHKFTKSSSITRLLGNTYNAKKFEKEEQKRLANDKKFHTYGGRRRNQNSPYFERFKSYNKDDGDVAVLALRTDTEGATLITDTRELFGGSRNELQSMGQLQEARNEDLGTKAFRTISRSLGKLWWKRTHSVDISTPDPEFKVSYLGNVLTGWAKGEGCVEKQLNTLWRNYTQNTKPDVIMRIKVCASGLKATTRQHGLTEYWANRITHCCAPSNYPRVFCWIYRHEGRKLKHELRCHAVLCSKERVAQDICNTLKGNLESALREFKREKILKQNARLSLANAAYDNPSLPRRKILLSVGGNNYRPPLERSKSAPKLMAIEEAIGEEDGDEVEDTNEPEMMPCCQKDSLYPAMTLGRRRCRRGHSIRRTGKIRTSSMFPEPRSDETIQHDEHCCGADKPHLQTKEITSAAATEDGAKVEEQRNSYGSDDSDDFEKLLKYNDYDTSGPLANELLPYFDMQLHKNTSSSLGNLDELKDYEEPLSLVPTINSDPNADPDSDYKPHLAHDLEVEVLGLRRNGVCSDGEEDYLDADDMYFQQAAMLNMLHRNSMRKMTNLSLSSDESSIETNASSSLQYRHQVQSSISSNASSTTTTVSTQEATGATTQRKQISADSDEGSISSGCETASTVTANQDDVSLKYRQGKEVHNGQQPPLLLEGVHQSMLTEEPITAEEIYQRLESRLHGRHNSDATTFSSSSSITLKMGSSPATSLNGLNTVPSGTRARRNRRQSAQREQVGDSDSECSDESGYVEYQERGKSQIAGAQTNAEAKPQPPPKPLPRRQLSSSSITAV